MTGPEVTPPTDLALGVAERHSAPAGCVALLDAQGVANWTYALGPDLVLRVARPGHDDDLAREAAVIPAASRAGVPVPDVVEHVAASDGSPSWMVQRRRDGVRLDGAALDEPSRRTGYHGLGRALRRLHDADLQLPRGALDTDDGADPGRTLADLAAGAWIGAADVEWLRGWFEHLDGWRPVTARAVVVHGDASGSNVLVTAGTGEVTAAGLG